MRIRFNIILTILSYSCASIAGVPLKWTVETSRAVHTKFDAYQGETLSFEATLQSYGKPLEAPAQYAFYWQTNGMGNAYWSAPCTVPDASRVAGAGTNVLFATFTPDMDVGAKSYNCFIGLAGSIYHVAFQLNLRPSPGTVPNELPLPQKVIDFAQVNVVNPPWPTGSARPLPPYLHAIDCDDTYPDDAAWAYERSGSLGRCSAKREGGALYRNYDWTFDSTAEFVVRVNGDANRFASIGVANCGTNLSEDVATSGKWSRWYKCLPGMTLDGINEAGVVAEINVCTTNGVEQWNADGSIHVLAAVRWALDHGTNAAQAAAYLAANVKRPQEMNFHYMIADERETWIVENGTATMVTGVAIMTNHGMFPFVQGPGVERDAVLDTGSITNVWWTKAYGYGTDWISDFDSEEQMLRAQELWNAPGKAREDFRGTGAWWQTVHTSVYDIENRTLRVAVQERPDWYTFAIPGGTGVSPVQIREIVQPMIADATNYTDRATGEVVRLVGALESSVSSLESSKRDLTNLVVYADKYITVTWNDPTLDPPISEYDTFYGGGPYWIETRDQYESFSPQEDQFEGPGWYVNDFGFYSRQSSDHGATSITDYISGPEGFTRFTWTAKDRTIVGVEPTTDRLATTSDLAAKRDLDDLSYVTTMPGGWTPMEVDGHRYDIYYDGYSGWYVEKLTYYPEWGEWYYDDYEWVEGPEDAETLVAHKIWSDETITFTRQQIEVSDSLVLSSQIGNQAEVAARNYIQNNDIAKTKTLLRTGRPGEHGTGWGTMHYQFSSDRRWWSMIVPSITASWTSGGYVDTSGTYVTASTVYFPGSYYDYYRADPINNRNHTPVAKFVESAGTNGTARCGAAKWAVGITAGPGSSTTTVRFDNSADLDAMPFLVTADVDHADGFGTVVFEDRSSVIPISFDLQDYYVNHYVISNFRFDEGTATVSGQSVSVKCLYDVNVSRTPTVKANYTAWCTLNLGCSAESYITTNPDYGRVMTDATRGLYYDRGLKATWRVGVTNGCFFAEVVSTNNVTEGVN